MLYTNFVSIFSDLFLIYLITPRIFISAIQLFVPLCSIFFPFIKSMIPKSIEFLSQLRPLCGVLFIRNNLKKKFTESQLDGTRSKLVCVMRCEAERMKRLLRNCFFSVGADDVKNSSRDVHFHRKKT